MERNAPAPSEITAVSESRIEITEHDILPKKTLMLLSIRSPFGCRHLLNDLSLLMPENTLRDTKMKEKFTLEEVKELAGIRGADNVFLLETRKKSPAPILWAFISEKDKETGEELCDVMKFSVTGVYTMQEVREIGNPLSNTQMITLFSQEFEKSMGLKRAKAILARIFNTTRRVTGEPQTTSCYTDKIASFFLLGGDIFARFYHISKKTQETEKKEREEAEKSRALTKDEKDAEAEEEKEKEFETGPKTEPIIHTEHTDPNLETVEKAVAKAPWYEIHEIGPRFTLHPRESDLIDNPEEEVVQPE